MKNKKIDRQIEAILFDVDGVLIDSIYFWFYLFNDTLKNFGYREVSFPIFKKHWGKSTEDDIKNFMPGCTLKEVKEYFYKNMQRFVRYLKFNHQVEPILKRLANRYNLGCVSNSHTEILQWKLKKTGLKKFFKVIISADDVKRPKPAPDMLLMACRKLKVSPDRTIFVGDTKTDLIAGRNAGCIVVGYKIKNKLHINNLKQLLTPIKRN